MGAGSGMQAGVLPSTVLPSTVLPASQPWCAATQQNTATPTHLPTRAGWRCRQVRQLCRCLPLGRRRTTNSGALSSTGRAAWSLEVPWAGEVSECLELASSAVPTVDAPVECLVPLYAAHLPGCFTTPPFHILPTHPPTHPPLQLCAPHWLRSDALLGLAGDCAASPGAVAGVVAGQAAPPAWLMPACCCPRPVEGKGGASSQHQLPPALNCLLACLPPLPLHPLKVPMTVVVGAPIVVPQVADPTPDEVQRFLQQYIAAIEGLFERHKAAAGHPNSTLMVY